MSAQTTPPSPRPLREWVIELRADGTPIHKITTITGVPNRVVHRWLRELVCAKCGEQLVEPAQLCGWCQEETAA